MTKGLLCLVRKMSTRLFEESDHANVYKKFRPLHPQSMAEFIVSFCKRQVSLDRHELLPLAVDVGCGSGQSSQMFAPYFQNVIGLDVSSAQIKEANTANGNNNVEFLVGSAESLPVENQTVSLLLCAQSFHWLDQEKFYKEVDRVLMPGGCLAVFAHHFNEFEQPSLNRIAREFAFETLKDYWDERRRTVDNGYRDIVLPYEDNERDDFQSITKTSLLDYLGYLSSLSSYRKFMKEHPDEPILKNIEQQFLNEMAASSSSEVTLTVIRRYFLLICSKPK
ncbi:putative methyltransferase DDB_G0268948 isoform X2 [Rhopilema esculentum]|uniref:putative methyltransferase DDB_G0268948 isoform X2 n=1 Tax=Rhopilema esculentum TaxID=499914 RepID=UPI0031DD8356